MDHDFLTMSLQQFIIYQSHTTERFFFFSTRKWYSTATHWMGLGFYWWGVGCFSSFSFRGSSHPLRLLRFLCPSFRLIYSHVCVHMPIFSILTISTYGYKAIKQMKQNETKIQVFIFSFSVFCFQSPLLHEDYCTMRFSYGTFRQ